MKKIYIKASNSIDDIISYNKSIHKKLMLDGAKESAIRLQRDTISYLEALREVGISSKGN